MEAIAALHQIAHLALGQCERGLLKLGHSLAAADPAERSTLLGAAWIFRILLSKSLELRATLELLQQVFGTVLGLGNSLFVDLAIRAGQRRLDQYVADFHLLRDAVLIAVLLVIALQIALGDLNAGLELRRINYGVLHFAFFGNGVGIRGLMAFVIRLQLSFGGTQPLLDVVLFEDGIIELNLGVLLDELLMNLGVGHARGSGNKSLKLCKQNVFADSVLEFGGGQLGALQHVFVFLLPNEIAVREECGGITSMLQFILDLVGRNAQAHATGLADQGLAGDELLGSALGKKRQEHAHISSALRHLLLEHLASRGADFVGGNVVSVDLGNHTPRCPPKTRGVITAARHEVPAHGNRDQQQ